MQSKENKQLKEFLILSDVYYQRLKRGMSLSNLVNQLEDEIYIYQYSNATLDEDLKQYSGFIEKAEDIESNYYALSYAASKYFNTKKTDNDKVNEYILLMTK